MSMEGTGSCFEIISNIIEMQEDQTRVLELINGSSDGSIGLNQSELNKVGLNSKANAF